MAETKDIKLNPGDILIVGPKGKLHITTLPEGDLLSVDIKGVVTMSRPFSNGSRIAKLAAELVDAVWENMFLDTGEAK